MYVCVCAHSCVHASICVLSASFVREFVCYRACVNIVSLGRNWVYLVCVFVLHIYLVCVFVIYIWYVYICNIPIRCVYL